MEGQMAQKSISQYISSVLYKYDIDHTDRGISANLDAWQSNKSNLRSLLSKHPNWDQDNLAVVVPVTSPAAIDRFALNEAANSILDLASDYYSSEDGATDPVYEQFKDGFCKLVYSYEKTIKCDKLASDIKELGVNCVINQKTSRVIRALCVKFELNNDSNFERLFAKIGDIINVPDVKTNIILSVHPCDYLTMSIGQSWDSCHTIDPNGRTNGIHKAGTLSYMNDYCSMILYTLDSDKIKSDAPLHTIPKLTCQVFAYNQGILLQSRLYNANDSDVIRDIYRQTVEDIIAKCLEMDTNVWIVRRNIGRILDVISCHKNGMQYPDYKRSECRPIVTLLKDVYNDNELEIGYTAYCLTCGDDITDEGELHCNDCDHKMICSDCGREIDEEDAININGDYYCHECVRYCDHCGEYVREEDGQYIDNLNIDVCDYCLERYYRRCDDCGDWQRAYDMTDVSNDSAYTWICETCIDNYTQCATCDEWLKNDDIQCINDEYYCSDCAAEIAENAENAEILGVAV
jgi:hypothetical protein